MSFRKGGRSRPGGAGVPVHPLYTDTGVLISVVRAGNGLTRQALADRAHVSYALLTKVEAGVEPASPELVAACGKALGVDSSLFAVPYRPDTHGDLLSAMVERTRATRDVLDLPPAEGVRPRPLPELAADVRQVGRWIQDSRFESAQGALPRLLAELRVTACTLTGPGRQTALRLVTEAERYGLVAGAQRANRAAVSGRILTPPSAPVLLGKLGTYGLGLLLGLGLAKLYYAENPLFQIVGGWLGLTTAWLLFWWMNSLGRHTPRGQMALFGYLGAQTAILQYALSTLHTTWWVLVLWAVSSIGLVSTRLRQRTMPTDFIGSQIVIVGSVVIGSLFTEWWIPLLCMAFSVGVLYARLNQPGPPDDFNDVFPPTPQHF